MIKPFRNQIRKSKMPKGKKSSKGKKKLSPEEIAAQEIQQEIQPIFELYDADRDGFLSIKEFPYFMKAVCSPLPPELEERIESTFTAIDIAIATEFVREVRENMHIADRMKEEFFSILNLSEVRTGPIQEIKTLNSILCVGEFKVAPKEIKWLLKHVQKNMAQDLQRQMIGEGKSQEEIKVAMDAVYKSDKTDIREIIKVMNFSIQTGTCLLPEEEKERKRKEEAAAKKKAEREKELKERQKK